MKTYAQALMELNEKYAKAQEVNAADVELVKNAVTILTGVSGKTSKVIAPAVKRLQSFIKGEKYCTRNRNKGAN